ncbi:hypothetical protein, partial [Phormidium sp. FACHB-1136]|uniref:hypothetical protein n=1 Tax=Phormidium sp. FACHB-1136 TaxID=2692848 RepID=UPI0018EFB920
MAEPYCTQQQLEAAQGQIQRLSQQLAAERDAAGQAQAQLRDQLEQQQQYMTQLEANIQRFRWII